MNSQVWYCATFQISRVPLSFIYFEKKFSALLYVEMAYNTLKFQDQIFPTVYVHCSFYL